MPSYLDLTQFKLRIGVTESTWDTPLTACLNGVEQSIATYVGYVMNSAAGTEYYDGNGTDRLVLNRRPIANAAAVTAVYEDTSGQWGQSEDPFPSTSLLTQGTDYAVEIDGATATGILIRLKTLWPVQWSRRPTRLASNLAPVGGCVKVTYTAGWSTGFPADVIDMAYDEAAARWASRLNGMGQITSEGMDGYNVSISAAQPRGRINGVSRFVSPFFEDVLRPYRRVAFA